MLLVDTQEVSVTQNSPWLVLSTKHKHKLFACRNVRGIQCVTKSIDGIKDWQREGGAKMWEKQKAKEQMEWKKRKRKKKLQTGREKRKCKTEGANKTSCFPSPLCLVRVAECLHLGGGGLPVHIISSIQSFGASWPPDSRAPGAPQRLKVILKRLLTGLSGEERPPYTTAPPPGIGVTVW